MKKLFSLIPLIVFSLYTSQLIAQEEPIYDLVEQMPEPEGGMEAFYKYLMRKIKIPQQARVDEVSGKVIVQFIVEKNGKITNEEIIQSLSPEMDKEILRVIKFIKTSSTAPKWKAGTQEGELVRVRMKVPIRIDVF